MAKVLPASAAQAFLDALQTSQILNAETLTKVREQFSEADDAKVVARDLIKEGKITKWQAQQLLGKFTALVVGNYKLLDQLGVGEMGRVYLAEHIQMQRKVALKVLARKHTSQPQVLRRLLAEARRVAGIEHPNITHIQDVNQDGERYFIVLEYFDAEDLQRQVQREGKLPAAKAWNFIRQAANGLAHAHSKGIVHGGLKPSNLLADQQGSLKILDFGLAQLAGSVEANSNDSVDQAAITAQMFRAPETAGQAATPQGDMYALGASLFYLLTGNPPADGPASALQLAKLAPDTPSGLLKLCEQLMAASPADRPQNDQALLIAIEAANPGGGGAISPAAKAPPVKAPAPAAKAGPPLKTAAALPTAKSLPEDAVAKAAPPKAKKPVVAKALPTVAEPEPAAEAVAAVSETPTASASSDTPFAGFALQTKGRGKSAPVPSTSGAMPALNAAAPPPKSDPADKPAFIKSGKGNKNKAAAKAIAEKSNLPLILAGGIGGGVLVLGAMIALIMFLMSGGDDPQVAKGDGENQATTEQKSAETPTGEANPAVEANPIVAEANPVVPTVEVKPMPVAPVVDPAVPPKTDPAKPDPMPMVTKQPDPPMVAVVPPVEPKPMPKPMPKPVPVGDPFVGFEKAVALPKLPAGMSEPTPEMLVAVVLGPCKVPDDNLVISAVLKGGETAYGKGKMKFTLEPANGGTSLRDWEFKMAGGTIEKPLIVATMSAKNDQLLFQWLPEAARQAAAPYICNCVIELSAGNGKTQFALRQPVQMEPIAIGIEKRSPPARFKIDLPPEPKQLMFEIVAVEGDVPKVKYDNKDLVADKETTFFWVGNVETEMPLGIKVDTALQGGNIVQVTTMPHFKIEPLTRPAIYGKKELGNFKQEIDNAMQGGNNMIQQAAKTGDAKAKSELNQRGSLLLEPAQKASAQFEQMLALAKGLQTNGKIHFRIYANAEDGKVELVNSNGAAAAAPGPVVPPPVLKAPANAKGNAAAPAAGKNPPVQPRPARPGLKAPVAKAPIGTIEATAEEVGNEALQTETAAFDEKFKGKQFRVAGTVDSVVDAQVHLQVSAMKDGQTVKVIMTFAKAADVRGRAKGAQVVIDGDCQNRAALGRTLSNCEVVSK